MDGRRPGDGMHGRRTRPLTVDEALQYSPLSSIVPFGPDPIPLIQVQAKCPGSLFASSAERNDSRQTLDALDREAYSGDLSSASISQTIQELQKLLDPDELTEFNFKTPAGFHLGGADHHSSNGLRQPSPPLGAFVAMVLDSTNVAFRFTPGSRSVKGHSIARDPPPSPTKARKSSTGEAAPGPAGPELQQDDSLARQRAAAIVISGQIPNDYETFPEVDGLSDDDKARRPSPHKQAQPSDRVNGSVSKPTDQREKSQASLQALKELIVSAFESEDQLQADTSATVSTNAAKYFVAASWSEGTIPTLAPAILVKLDQSIQRVISDGRFSDIAADDLTRLQGLCDGALKAAETVDVKVEDGWSHDEFQHWLRRVDVMDTGLKSARTLLRIMSGGREEKHLYSEEMLHSILRVLQNALDACIVPIVELRSSGDSSETFKALVTFAKIINSLLNHSSRIMRLLAKLLGKEDVTESVITTVEFVASALIFVENAHSEKESVLGVQKFERLRVTAMDVLVRIFSRYPDQRTFIFDEVLTSLERLPVTRQGARHFKLSEGGNIQLVSALIMRLVQTSAIRPEETKADKSGKTLGASNGEDEDEEADGDAEEDTEMTDTGRYQADDDTEAKAERYPEQAVRLLANVSSPLFDTAQKNAHYVIQFLVSRALKSTKSGDDPYRVLLDIFTEDFITVLSSTDWPAAELLLRLLLTSMIGIIEGEKSPAPAKNMALDLMGLMGSAICDMVAHIRQSSKSLESSETGLDGSLGQLTEDFLEGKTREVDLLVWNGPYRATLEFLQQRDLNDGQIESARGYYTTQWAITICAAFPVEDGDDDDDHIDSKAARLAYRLRRMIMDLKWLETEYDFDSVSTTQGRLAYALTVLNMPFSKAFERILLILLNSMNSDQATVRSKSMKSVIQLLEKDPTILDRGAYVMRSILTRTCDPSPLVRDSAVGLVGKCLTLKPVLEDQVWESVLARVTDAQVGVRKRAMKILKGIYLRNGRKEVKSTIADALLHRVKDADEGVSELARQTLEEIWITPFHRPAGAEDESVQHKLALTEQIFLIVKTVQRGESVASVLDSLIQASLSNESKSAAANFRVCKLMVAIMFDEILDESEQADKPKQSHILRTLTVFARANAKLFTGDQLELLQPYLQNLSTTDDLHVYRSVVVIFRWVLPHISSLKGNILLTVQGALLGSLSKLGKRELNEVIPCLWTINSVLKNPERLSRATISCLKGVYAARVADLSQPGNVIPRVVKYLTIAGLFGKYCDFSSDVARFKADMPWWRDDSVPGLMVDVFAPFTRAKQPLVVRSASLEALGAICYTWPKQFLREQVYSAFDLVFAGGNQELETIVLTGFKDFLGSEERRSEKAAELPTGDEGHDLGSGRLGGALTANQNDGVSSSIAQRYLQHIIRIATATQDGHALLAVEVIGSVSRQGVLHPKECGPVLVALETSQNAVIAGIAFREHRTLHQKHETVLEKEYMKAVQQAFVYQRDIVGDARGATAQPYVSKLRPMFDVIKISKGKMRKKFLGSMCTRIDFDPGKLDVRADVPLHLQYARFLTENMAYFEYNTVEEVLHVISCIERLVAGTGTGVAHAIETEVFKMRMEPADSTVPQKPDVAAAAEQSVSDGRLRQLTAASMILHILWDARSYLRRLYGFQGGNKNREAKAKPSAKELNKSPVKVPFVTGEKLWEEIGQTMGALADNATMLAQCRRFVDLLSVDHDFKVAGDEAEEPLTRMETPSEDEAGGTSAPPSGSTKGGKRKASSETPGKRGKKQRRSSMSKGRKGSEDSHDEDWM
ncbi:MAG: Sister chromatid cohesion protein 2 [Thelocarpon impressellum]|nr:MAG: Sister chromatid cohesion protein 2 [Thelocarpon impressellum]